ncbi:glutathione S-transferase U17-like [Bidens hawaiensis]|uniref:glutathione S-transferase U17-like n=1 Tax=Bidens hawaiensis TaxID=980011 RepID=UPI004049326E
MLTQESKRKEEYKRLIIGGSAMLEEAFIKLSKGNTFFGGDEIGYIDVVMGCYLGWFKFFGIILGFDVIDEAINPRLAQWGKSMWAHEAIKTVIPSDEVYMNFFKMLLGFLPVPMPLNVSA